MKRFHIVIIAAMSVITVSALVIAYLLWTNLQSSKQTQEAAINDLNAHINDLNAHINDLTAQIGTLTVQNDDLSRHVHLSPDGNGVFYSFVLRPISKDIAVLADSRLPSNLINMLTIHFTAMYAGDRSTFISTLTSANNDWLMHLLEKPDSPNKLKVILIWSYDDADTIAFGDNYGGYMQATLFYDDSSMQPNLASASFTVGVTNKSGKWLVYDYD